MKIGVRYYHGKGKVSLRSIAEEREVQLTFSKGPVVVAAVGDAGAGKSGFLNALAEELVLSTSSKEAVQWVVGEEVKHGHWPGLLLGRPFFVSVAERFQDLLGLMPILFNHRSFQNPAVSPGFWVFFLETRVPGKNGTGRYP